MFDSKEYSFADIELRVGGVKIADVQEVSYKETQTKETIYGKGALPVAIQRGQRQYSGSITLLQSDYNALVRATPGKSILDVHCDILVTYGNSANGDVLITDALIGCEFTEAENKMAQTDTYMRVALPFIFLRKENLK